MKTEKEIRIALESLPVKLGKQAILDQAVRDLARIYSNGSGTKPNKYKAISHTRTINELDKVANLAKDLAATLEELHYNSILALADSDFCGLNYNLPPLLNKFSNAANKTKSNIRITKPETKPKNVRAHAVGLMLAYYYQQLTGKKPTITIRSDKHAAPPEGPFLDLVQKIFQILELADSPEHIAKSAIMRSKKAKEKTLS